MSRSSLEFDAVLDLCGNQHRRIVLGVLADQQRTLTMDDLTKAIVKHNHHTPLTEVSGETVSQIKTSLDHVHIPKVEAAGLIEYDSGRQLVEATERFERFEPHISEILDADPGLAPPLDL